MNTTALSFKPAMSQAESPEHCSAFLKRELNLVEDSVKGSRRGRGGAEFLILINSRLWKARGGNGLLSSGRMAQRLARCAPHPWLSGKNMGNRTRQSTRFL